MQEGEADVSCDRGNGKLTKGSCVLIKDGEKYGRVIIVATSLSISSSYCRFTVKRPKGSIGISVTTDPLANKAVH